MLLQIVLLWLFRFIKLPNFLCCNREDWVQFGTLVEHDEQSSKPWLGCLNLTRQALQRNFSWVRDNRWFCSRYCAFVKSSWCCRFCSCSFCFCMIWRRLAIVVLYSLHLRHLLIGKGSDKHLAILSMILFLHVVSSATFFVVCGGYWTFGTWLHALVHNWSINSRKWVSLYFWITWLIWRFFLDRTWLYTSWKGM